MDGFLNILKPPGPTSHDVVRTVRSLIPGTKTGHGGTLDPDAAGVLPMLIGKATRLSSFLLEFPKLYRAEMQLGLTTDTEDASGRITGRKTVPELTPADLEKVFKLFRGEIQQTPPMYSAVKKKGKKLYQYARAGIEVERAPRKVFIHSIEIIEFNPPCVIIFEVKCSKGTYIRTLCAQIGDYLECGGAMSSLLRKQVGPFNLGDAHSPEELGDLPRGNRIGEFLLPLDFIFRDRKKLVFEETETNELCFGRFLTWEKLLNKYGNEISEPLDETVIPVYTKSGVFTLLARWKKDATDKYYLKPETVFT